MHTLVFVGRNEFRDHMHSIVSDLSSKHSRPCYISFNDPYHIVIEMLQNANVGHEKFIVIDASSGNVIEQKEISKQTYVLPINDLFNVYLFLKNLIVNERVDTLLLDSLSALIVKHNHLPLKSMMTNLLLEVGALRCSSSIVVFKDHAQHEVVQHLDPMIRNRITL
jgi:hypothetical protein